MWNMPTWPRREAAAEPLLPPDDADADADALADEDGAPLLEPLLLLKDLALLLATWVHVGAGWLHLVANLMRNVDQMAHPKGRNCIIFAAQDPLKPLKDF